MMDSTFLIGLLITIVLGFGWGSFATMATYRLPRNMPWIGDKPRCFMCKTPLSILDYFSVFSFFIHRGTCRHCGGKYEENLGYFLTELGITGFLVLAFLQFYFSDWFVLANGVIVGGMILAVIDAQHQKIPAKVLVSMFTLGAIYRTYIDGTFYGLLYGCVLGALVGVTIRYLYFALKGQKQTGIDFTRWQHTDRFSGPGFDYVKLLIIVGGWLPFTHFLVFVMSIGSLILLWSFIHPRSLRIGTLMALGLIVSVIYSPQLSMLLF